jgi:enterochelin esterase-like enzyme
MIIKLAMKRLQFRVRNGFLDLVRRTAWSALIVLAVLIVFRWLLYRTLNGALLTILVSFGLDPQRGSFVSALLLTIVVCLAGALLTRLWAMLVLGGLLFFVASYFSVFLIAALQPVYTPGGLLEPLDALALLHTSLMMLALAILACGIGIALGHGVARVLIDPVARLFVFSYRRWRRPQDERREESGDPVLRIVGGLFGSASFVAVLLLALGSLNLFVYAPDVDLHRVPTLTYQTKTGRIALQSTILHDTYRSSAMGGQLRTFVVYLPPSYNLSEDKTRRYPVLYLLHGSPGQETNWLTGGKAGQSEDILSALGKAPEMILIMPDGNGRAGQTSEWGNSGDGKQMLENAIVNDLVPYVDQKYRTLTDARHRAIGGLSMGGFGAANIGIHHPSVFGSIIALGGYYRADGKIWGTNPAYLRANSPAIDLLQQKLAWQSHYFIGGATRDELYQDSLHFASELKQLHVAYIFDSVSGFHAWNVWQVELYHALQWLNTAMQS